MTKKALEEGLSLFGFEVSINSSFISFDHKDISVEINRTLTEEEVKLLLLNIPRWTTLANEARDRE